MRLALILAAAVVFVVPTPTGWVESFYSRQLYLIIQNVLTPLTSATRVVLFDLLLTVGAVGLSGWWFVALWQSSDRRLRVAGQLAINTLALLAGVYLVFVLVWGLNYRREPLIRKIDFSQERVTGQALNDAGLVAVARLNELHAAAHAERWLELDELPEHLGSAFEVVQGRFGVSRTAVTGVPKPTLLTPYFKRAGVDGMISPFSLEVLVNADVLPFERPFVVAHEWAHLAGYADESEASFVGWLTCLAGDARSRYSAWIFLAPHLFRHLGDEARPRMWGLLDDGPINDFRTVSDRLSQVVPLVRRNASRVYDQYLQANRVEAGIQSYSMVVDLVLGSELGRLAVTAE